MIFNISLSSQINYLLLHIIVFIWGFTGILGDLISLDAEQLVWYRMGIASIALLIYNVVTRQPLMQLKTQWIYVTLASLFVVLHWVFFFGSIKASNISIGVVCMSTQAFMMSLIQPLIKKGGIRLYELLLGILVIVAMVMIFGFEYHYKEGIFLGLISSLFAVFFTLFNAKFIKEYKATIISGWEMTIGFALMSVWLAASGGMTTDAIALKGHDLWYLLILAIVCTAVAFAVSVQIMKKLSAYTVSLSVNLEPIYTILLALLFFGEKEKMSVGFYAGAGILILTVVAEPLLSKYWKK